MGYAANVFFAKWYIGNERLGTPALHSTLYTLHSTLYTLYSTRYLCTTQVNCTLYSSDLQLVAGGPNLAWEAFQLPRRANSPHVILLVKYLLFDICILFGILP